jgi:hypothetical protein
MREARMDATATLLQNGKVLIIGGSSTYANRDTENLASAELYDPATGKFSKTGSMAAGRAFPTATLLKDGRVLIAGGNTCTDPKCVDVEPTASAELYDPATAQFSPTGSMTTARFLATSTLLPDGRVLLAQGSSELRQWGELYDPTSGEFARTGEETTLAYPTATLLGSGQVLLTGKATVDTQGAELFDEAGGRFTAISFALATGAAPSAQYKVEQDAPETATLLKDGRVLFFEGDYLETYDPGTGACAPAGFVSPAGQQWTGPTATMLADGRVLFAGGQVQPSSSREANWVVAASAALYDPSGRSQMIDSVKTRLADHTATLLPYGSVLIAGGGDQDGNARSSAELFK